MSQQPRTLFIAGNWKMNPASEAEAVALAEAVKVGVGARTDVHVAICPPAVFLARIDQALENTPIGLGAQNMNAAPAGAYTGEISGAMLVDAGCTHVILGHSERRHGMGENDAMVNQKLHAALSVGLLPIVCLGELLAERDAGQTEAVLARQLEGTLAGVEAEQMGRVVLAYEPVWAIGTGKVATTAQAQDAHAFIRNWLADRYTEAISGRVVIQYGGSVRAENAGDLLACPDVDGALVGGASLKPDEFLAIIAAGREASARGA
jgi:triosephosphate isomerase